MQQGSIPWQRGRIERHGGIIKEMLNRIDHEKPIDTLQQLDDALQQCFNAKNTMSVVNGFSPEQAVLGRASKLPASLALDENLSAHLTIRRAVNQQSRGVMHNWACGRLWSACVCTGTDASHQICSRKVAGVALRKLCAKSLAPSFGFPIWIGFSGVPRKI